jgi:hypothetical protein
MASNSQSSRINLQAQVERDLLHLLLEAEALDIANAEEADASVYPWNPAHPDSEVFFANLEADCNAVGWSLDELAPYAQTLGQSLEALWTEAPALDVAAVLPAAALQPFQIPQSLLTTIVQRAQEAIASNITLADQLVQCVRDALPNLADEDLQVLARPYAYAMRGSATESLEAALRTMRCAAWTELSGIEQARLSLAIARYAIAQMPSTGTSHG